MRISFKLNTTQYHIDVDDKCYTPCVVGVNTKEGSANEGKETETTLGYFKNISNAALRCVREEIAVSPDTVTLKEYAARIEALNNQIKEQFKGVEA